MVVAGEGVGPWAVLVSGGDGPFVVVVVEDTNRTLTNSITASVYTACFILTICAGLT